MDDQTIVDNYEIFNALVMDKVPVSDGERELLGRLLDDLGERIAACAATHKDEPGSLVAQNLANYKSARSLNKKFNLGLAERSLALVCLFRNIGMIGNEENDLLLPQDNEWRRRELGEHFKYNNDMQFMQPHDRSLWWLAKYGIEVNEEEHISILTSGGKNEQ
jgi:hypothetical protein